MREFLSITVIIVALFLLISGCKTSPPRADEIEGTYRYKNDRAHMVLKINKGGNFSWSISEKNKIIKTQSGRWEAYNIDGDNPRLIIKGFCFPPGVLRSNSCTDEYPAIIERDYISGNLSIPLDVDHSNAALVKSS
jgi:hypothetical protein